jgi:hypothetical protein
MYLQMSDLCPTPFIYTIEKVAEYTDGCAGCAGCADCADCADFKKLYIIVISDYYA